MEAGQAQGPTRRSLLAGAGGLALGATAGVVAGSQIGSGEGDEPPSQPKSDSPSSISPFGATQAGIVEPSTPQRNGLISIFTVSGSQAVRRGLPFDSAFANLGRAIAAVVDPTTEGAGSLDSPPGDLTVTIGIGADLAGDLGLETPPIRLPDFAGDKAIASSRRGGDILVATYASDSATLAPATDRVAAQLADDLGTVVRLSFAQFLSRGAGSDGIVRNPLGFHDGVIIPRGEKETRESVWISSGPWAGGTINVLRMLRLDRERFGALSADRQNQIIGRDRSTGQPLSGGENFGEVDLRAKTPEGDFLIPHRSHVRAAHPSFTGSALMLRRGYAFDNGVLASGEREAGLMFNCFQNDIETFTRTQLRLDTEDDLMAFATPLGSWSFLILPGYSPERPLGAPLFQNV